MDYMRIRSEEVATSSEQSVYPRVFSPFIIFSILGILSIIS